MDDRPKSFPLFKSAPKPRKIQELVKHEKYQKDEKHQEDEKQEKYEKHQHQYQEYKRHGTIKPLYYREKVDSLSFVDHKGDFEIFRYDCKLKSNTVPEYRLDTMQALGFPRHSRLSYDESGDFSLVQAKGPAELKRFFQNTDIGKYDKFIPSHKEPDEAFYLLDHIGFETHHDNASPTSLASLRLEQTRLHQKVKKDPLDVSSWITLAKLQEELALRERLPRMAVIKRQIAILQEALLKTPDSSELLKLFFHLQNEIQPVFELWNFVLSKFGSKLDLRWAQIEFYYEHCFTIFSIQKAFELWIVLARDLSSGYIKDYTKDVGVAVIKQVLFLLVNSGYVKDGLHILGAAIMRDYKAWVDDSSSNCLVKSNSGLSQWYDAEKRDVLKESEIEDFINPMNIQIFGGLGREFREHDCLNLFYYFLDLIGVATGTDELTDSTFTIMTGKTPPCLSLWYAPSHMLVHCRKETWMRPFLDNALAIEPNFYISKNCLGTEAFVEMLFSNFGNLFSSSSRALYTSFRIRRAQFLASIGRDGVYYLQGILENEPENWDLWLELSYYLRWRKEHFKAEKMLKKLLNSGLVPLEAGLLPLCLSLCEILISADRIGECSQFILKALKVGEGLSTSQILIAEKILDKEGKIGSTLKAILRASCNRPCNISRSELNCTLFSLENVVAGRRLNLGIDLLPTIRDHDLIFYIVNANPQGSCTFLESVPLDTAKTILLALPAKRTMALLATHPNLFTKMESNLLYMRNPDTDCLVLYETLRSMPFLKFPLLELASILYLHGYLSDASFVETINILEEKGCKIIHFIEEFTDIWVRAVGKDLG